MLIDISTKFWLHKLTDKNRKIYIHKNDNNQNIIHYEDKN